MSDLYFDPSLLVRLDDPFPLYRRLRDEAPLYYNDRYDFYALSRYADVRAALAQPRELSSAHGITLEDLGASLPPSIITLDPPKHTSLRRLISSAFTRRRVNALETPVRELARSLLAELEARGECDLIDDFAAILPMAVICELLGVPVDDRAQVRAWSEATIAREGDSVDAPESAVSAGLNLQQYFERLVAQRRKAPGDDIVSALIAIEDQGERVSHEEVIGFLWLLLVAGNDTSTRTIGNACYWLDRNRDMQRLLAADPARIPGAVEETLRYDGAAHVIFRTVLEPVEIAGRRLEPRRKLALILASANRDERHWPDADRFDVTRDPTGHLGFGQGIHHCLGAPLGRLEVRVALEQIFARIPDFELVPGSAVRARSNAFRGFKHLGLRWRPH